MRLFTRGRPETAADPVTVPDERGAASGADPGAVLDELCDAAAAGDTVRMRGACEASRGLILASFERWYDDARSRTDDKDARRRRIYGLAMTAQTFANELGCLDLVEAINRRAGDDADTAFDPYGRLQQARALAGEGRYEDAREVFAEVAAMVPGMIGTGVDDIDSASHFGAGFCLLAVGDADAAVAPLERALEADARRRDASEVAACAEYLFDAHRLRGDAAAAASKARLRASALERLGDADAGWWRAEAAIVEAGEPLVRTVFTVGGRRWEQADLAAAARVQPGGELKFGWAHWRNRPQIARAARLAAEGMAMGGAGDLDGALARFDAASALDPTDPHPVYNAGVALLELGRFADARERFEATERLAPGWFWCRRYAWLAGQIEAGALPAALARLVVITGEDGYDAARRLALLEPAIAALPTLGWLRLHASFAQQKLGRQAEAIASVRAGLDGLADPDVRSSLLVQLGMLLGSGPEAGRAFEEALRIADAGPAAAPALVALAMRAASARLS